MVPMLVSLFPLRRIIGSGVSNDFHRQSVPPPEWTAVCGQLRSRATTLCSSHLHGVVARPMEGFSPSRLSRAKPNMVIGVPRERKPQERRVALTPAGARELIGRGHDVLVETGAGQGSGIADADFADQGAAVVADWAGLGPAELIVKVKEPDLGEAERLRADQVLFTYLHLASAPGLTEVLRQSGAVCIAYETVEDRYGRLPLLAPMSEIAGKLAAQAGAFHLDATRGGRGVLLGGIAGVPGASVVVIGGGVVGTNAAIVARGLGANVTIFDRSLDRLREIDVVLGGQVSTMHSSALAIEGLLPDADLVIGAVLVRGEKAPKVLSKRNLGQMRQGTVLVDVAIDQGGCFETSHPTTHGDPVFEVDGVNHYCVANMPGAVPVTATRGLTHATLPYIVALADQGVRHLAEEDRGFALGVNLAAGAITHPGLAAALGEAPQSAASVL